MPRLVKRLIQDERAQDLAEYGIALAVVAGFAVLIAIAVAGNVQTLWSNAQSNISSVVQGES